MSLMDQNAKQQLESWLKAERLNCRKRAMEISLQIKLKDGGDLLKEAEVIYDWLTKDLK